MEMPHHPSDRLISFGPWLFGAVALFLLVEFMGEVYPVWIANNLCFQFIGCNAGFFGFDALIHGVSGVAETLSLFWIAERSFRFNIFHTSSVVTSGLLVLSIVTLISFAWEIIEFGYDEVRMYIFNVHLTMYTGLTQPSNADTMGDLTFGILGAVITLLVVAQIDRRLLVNNNRPI